MDCGVSRTAWHKWEDGATPNGATLSKFAEYFGVSVSFLLGEKKEKAPTASGSLSEDAVAVARAYDKATERQKQMVRLTLDL